MQPSPKRRALTKRQQEIFDYVRDKIVNRGYGPTVREIGSEFGIRSPNGVMCHLKALEKKGLIIRQSNMSRAITLTDSYPQHQSVAFLGTAVSGGPFRPAVSSEEREEFVGLLKGRDRAALHVVGSAFVSLGIVDGDCLIISRDQQGMPDDLVVFLDDRHHVTLDRIPKDGGTPVPAIEGSSRGQILGVLAGIVRRFGCATQGNLESNGTSRSVE
jgi:repressor LexA